ncbi:MAG: cytochrome c [Calditrichaeota bacterium]|nr:MAG: cytochrome c [Calditrichota bacterium]
MYKSRENDTPGLTAWAILSWLLIAVVFSACRQDMHDQPRYEPLEASSFFEDGLSARALVPGTVPRGELRNDDHLYRGRVDGELATTFPFPITEQVLRRGRERYNIYCSPCHDYLGYGHGMIVQRGFRPPPSFHIDRLRNVPVGHIFDVITNGLGAMYSYADRISPRDRWAIVAYVRTLQFSQNATIEDVPAEEQERLLESEK